MKFKEYLGLITAPSGFIPLPRFQWVIRENQRNTAREEAIAAEVLRQANPRENITGHFPWGPEQQLVLQQLWIHPAAGATAGIEWRDVPTPGGRALYSVEKTEHGELPVPNIIKEPEMIQGDFGKKIREILGEDDDQRRTQT